MKLPYKELLDLGFTRIDIFANDPVFFNQHGYECFWLEFIFFKKKKSMLYIHWYPETGKFELISSHKSDILSRFDITEKEALTMVGTLNRT